MHNTSDETIYDVVVIGCGLAGVTVANLLGQFHLRTLIIERDSVLYAAPRAIVLDDEVLRILQAIGMGEQLGELTAPLEQARYINGSGHLLLDIPLKDTAAVSGYPFVNAFYQPELEGVLRAKLARFPGVTLRTGQEVERIAQDADAVHLTVRDLASDHKMIVHTRYALGCDGARSFTRRALGIALQDFHQDAAWLVLDTEIKGTDPFPMWNFQVCSPVRPTTFVHGKGKHLRWEFKLRRGETPEDVTRPERLRALIHHAPVVGIDPELLDIQRSAVYTFHATIAERWQEGRIFLLGDAAHQMPPFLGQGASAGIRDAVNLAWKLQMVAQGHASASLLASYEVERRPHVHAIIQRVIAFGSVIQTTNRILAWVRDRVLALQSFLGRSMVPDDGISPPLLDGILVAASPGRGKPRDGIAAQTRGHMLLQRPVMLPDGRVVPLDDALGQVFALVAYGCDPRDVLAHHLLERFTQLGGHVVQVVPAHTRDGSSPPERVCDHTGALQQWFSAHAMQVALVRPDRYLFGGGTLALLPDLLQQLFMILPVPSHIPV